MTRVTSLKHVERLQETVKEIIHETRYNRRLVTENLLLASSSPESSIGNSDLLIPQPVVVRDNETGRRPKLTENVRLRARGWSSFKLTSC